VHPGRIAAFGLLDPATGTEAVAIVAELDPSAWPMREDVATAIRDRVARRTDAVAGTVHLVPAGWLVKTSSGKVARSANREKYCREANVAV
jgi:hypothetical protein